VQTARNRSWWMAWRAAICVIAHDRTVKNGPGPMKRASGRSAQWFRRPR
jgi:hypothetical protein